MHKWGHHGQISVVRDFWWTSSSGSLLTMALYSMVCRKYVSQPSTASLCAHIMYFASIPERSTQTLSSSGTWRPGNCQLWSEPRTRYKRLNIERKGISQQAQLICYLLSSAKCFSWKDFRKSDYFVKAIVSRWNHFLTWPWAGRTCACHSDVVPCCVTMMRYKRLFSTSQGSKLNHTHLHSTPFGWILFLGFGYFPKKTEYKPPHLNHRT